MVRDVLPALSTGKDRLDFLMDWSAFGTLPSLGVVDHDENVKVAFVIDRHVPKESLEPERLVVARRAELMRQKALIRHDEVNLIGVSPALLELREPERCFLSPGFGGDKRPRRRVHE